MSWDVVADAAVGARLEAAAEGDHDQDQEGDADADRDQPSHQVLLASPLWPGRTAPGALRFVRGGDPLFLVEECQDTQILGFASEAKPCGRVARALATAGTAPRAPNVEPEMVGERILGRFRIEAAIGSGGFGTVYRAWDERLQRPVAVKVVERSDASPRVMREAQAVARLAHRNIATLYELAGEGERAYLVSELIEGETLRALARRGELNDRLVAEVGAGCAAALAHAHRAGVVHRDVKPENVIVATGGGGQAGRLRDRADLRRAHPDEHRATWSARSPTWRPSRPTGSAPAQAPTCTRSPSPSTSASAGSIR